MRADQQDIKTYNALAVAVCPHPTIRAPPPINPTSKEALTCRVRVGGVVRARRARLILLDITELHVHSNTKKTIQQRY